jgi:uroporphyrinogen decarboxylase
MNPILNALKGKASSHPPLWLMRQAGRYLPEYRALRQTVPGFMELCFNEDLATEVTLQPLKRYDLDAAILFSDILVIPHVLGQSVCVLEKRGPVLSPLNGETFFDQAKDVHLKEALAVPLNILRNVRDTLPSTKAVIGFAGSPWTIATYMLEGGKSATFDYIKYLLETESPLFVQTMSLLEEAVGTFLIAQIEAGADVVQVFDSWARAVPIEHQDAWIVSPMRRIISRIQAASPTTPIIYYGRGVANLYPKIALGFTNIAFSVDETVSIHQMKDEIQKLGVLQGNLSPQILVEGGPKMKNNVRELVEAFQGRPYIFNLGHGIVPQTPVDHVSEIIELVKGRG